MTFSKHCWMPDTLPSLARQRSSYEVDTALDLLLNNSIPDSQEHGTQQRTVPSKLDAHSPALSWLFISWVCVPSPQSKSQHSPSQRRTTAEAPRVGDGYAAPVPRKVTSIDIFHPATETPLGVIRKITAAKACSSEIYYNWLIFGAGDRTQILVLLVLVDHVLCMELYLQYMLMLWV